MHLVFFSFESRAAKAKKKGGRHKIEMRCARGKTREKERDVVISECVRCVEDSVCGTSARLAEGIEDVKRVGSLGDQKKLPNMPPPDLAVPRPDEDPNRLSEGDEEDESCRRLIRLWREPITYTPRRKERHVGQHRTRARSQRGPGKRKTHLLKLVLPFLEIEMRADGRVLPGKGGVFL